MLLTVKLGATVVGDVIGHSALNGATLPEGTTVTLTSNDPAVATVPDPIVIPAGGVQTLTVPVTILATGFTDIHVTVKTPNGDVFEDTSTLTVEPAPEPGLVRVELVLREVVV